MVSAIRQLESGSGNRVAAVAALRSVFAKLESEHAPAGAALEALSALTDRYLPRDWACNPFRARFDTLGRLESNMHQHVHKENKVLFPRARSLGSSL